MAKSFTEIERENIKRNLLNTCRQYWTQYGYKKTSVDEICKQAGISKGAFYFFYESKEALFCEVLCLVQEEICAGALNLMEKQRDKHGVASALKMIYREYDKNNFLYESNSIDFIILKNKLSEEKAKQLEESGQKCWQIFIQQPYLKYKVEADMALSIFYCLIMNLKNKEILPGNHVEIFDFMVDHLIDSLYE